MLPNRIPPFSSRNNRIFALLDRSAGISFFAEEEKDICSQ